MSSNVLLEDILDALMLEESEPSYAALLRWSDRYPQFRDDLADFFATWAIQEAETEDEPEIDEDRIVEESVRYALEIARNQGRVVPKAAPEPLSPFDQLVVAAIYLLRGEACSGSIVEKVSEMSGAAVSFGPVFSSLHSLEGLNLISVRWIHLETQPEGRARRYFTVTRDGETALAQARQTSKVLAGFLADFA